MNIHDSFLEFYYNVVYNFLDDIVKMNFRYLQKEEKIKVKFKLYPDFNQLCVTEILLPSYTSPYHKNKRPSSTRTNQLGSHARDLALHPTSQEPPRT